MNVISSSRLAACMCGQVRMRVSVPPVMTMACHCKGCQKLSASAFFSLTAMIPSEASRCCRASRRSARCTGRSQ